MRIAMVAPPWLPIPPNGYGGIENVLRALVPALLEQGVQVELFTVGESTIKATKKHHLYKEGQYQHIHDAQYESLPITGAHQLFAIQTILRDGQFDLIHDHNSYIGPLLYAHASADLPPVVHTLHGPPFSPDDKYADSAASNLPFWRQVASAPRMHFVPISDWIAKTAPAILKPRLLPRVYNPIQLQDSPFEPKKDDYFITLARVHPDKGQHVAVKACLDLGAPLKMAGAVAGITRPRQLLLELANPLSHYRSVPDFRYYSDKIFPYVDEQIQYLGDVGGQDKLKLLAKARALLFPIQWDEPFGMAAIEALACGTPVVAMARGALPEIIKHGVNGFLAHNMHEFKQYMRRIDQIDPQACRESVAAKFSATIIAEQYKKHYQEVCKRHPRKR